LLPPNDTLRLKNIAPGDRLNEVEFYYPIKRFDSRALSSATALNLGRLQFSPVDGFLRGFMDLVFRHEGRYYLLDWKSNWLGSRPSDYSRQNLDRTMHQSFYSLQSLLYALAVDRYLKQRLPEYRYDRDFGGIFYIFVRGLDDSSPEYGIHYSKPDHHLLSRLGAALIREGQLR
jgi:exodeoxyribonuclease V beta subunit